MGGKSSQPVARVPEPPVSSSPDTGCPHGGDKRQSDLCAQWKAADAARDAANAANDQVLVGWIGLVLGFITMGAAIAAAAYAKRAAVATEETVGIARDGMDGAAEALSIAQRNADAAINLAESTRDSVENTKALVAATAANSRPWIKIDVRPTGPLICKNGALQGTFAINVQCLGKMPALNIILSASMATQPDEGVLYAGLCIEQLRTNLLNMIANKIPFGNEAFPGESYVNDRFGAGTENISVRQGEFFPVMAVGAMYKWAGGTSETLMSYSLIDRHSQRLGFPVGDWEIPADRIEIRRDGVHSIT